MAATDILGCNQPFQFLKYKGATIDPMGRDVPEFEDAVALTGSLQPVSNKMYEQLGLDLNKNYIVIYCPALMQSVAQKPQPDRIVFQNRTYELVEDKDWYVSNGWTRAIAVELKELRESQNGTTA